MTKLDGKIAFVTGGSRGIGAAIAADLAKAGATVALTWSHSEERAESLVKEIEAGGGTAVALRADNRDPDAIAAAINDVKSRYGRIDILVNNAGIFEVAPIDELTLDQLDRTLDINVRGAFLATRAAVPHMADDGRIIFIGSNLATRVPHPGLSAYSMSKSALIGLTKAVARDLGPQGITVNIIHPGSTDTDMNPADGPTADDQRSGMAIQRYNEPTEVASLVLWLCDRAAATVTGSEITIDSGSNA